MKNHRIYYPPNPLILTIICINVALITIFITSTIIRNLKDDVSFWVMTLIIICHIVVTFYISVMLDKLFKKYIFKLLDKQDEKSKAYHLDNFLHSLNKDNHFYQNVLCKDYTRNEGGNKVIKSVKSELLYRKEQYIKNQ